MYCWYRQTDYIFLSFNYVGRCQSEWNTFASVSGPCLAPFMYVIQFVSCLDSRSSLCFWLICQLDLFYCCLSLYSRKKNGPSQTSQNVDLFQAAMEIISPPCWDQVTCSAPAHHCSKFGWVLGCHSCHSKPSQWFCVSGLPQELFQCFGLINSFVRSHLLDS